MSFGARSAGTRQTIWRTTFNLRYLIENRNRAVLFDHDWIEFISVFSQQLLVESISSVVSQIVSTQERSSKPKVRRTLLTNHRKRLMWGHFRIAHREMHTVNNPCHSSLHSASLLVCGMLNFTEGNIWISKAVFFRLTHNANMLESN